MADNTTGNPILDGPLHQDGFEPEGDFAALAAAVTAGNIPQDRIDAAATTMQAEIAKAQSNSQIISIATGILGGLAKAAL